jgi:hypothetical protein
MAEATKARPRRPTLIEIRARVVAAIERFIAENAREAWHAAFASDRFRLLVDDDYAVIIAEMAAPTASLFLFSLALVELGLDPWAVELGGGVKNAALEIAADSVMRKLERSKWWVP